MYFDLLERLKPDHSIELDNNNCVLSIDNKLLKQMSPNHFNILYNIPLNEFLTQFNKDNQPGQYNEQFISDITFFISKKRHALMLLNSNLLDNTQTKGLLLFIISAKRTNTGISLEFNNLIKLTSLVNKLFSFELWKTFKDMVSENNHCFVSQQLYMAYQAILPLFLLTNTSEINIQAKPKWNELGEVLFYFNPYSKNKKISSTSGRNVMSDGLVRSENELISQITLGVNPNTQDLIHGNLLTKNQIIILN